MMCAGEGCAGLEPRRLGGICSRERSRRGVRAACAREAGRGQMDAKCKGEKDTHVSGQRVLKAGRKSTKMVKLSLSCEIIRDFCVLLDSLYLPVFYRVFTTFIIKAR